MWCPRAQKIRKRKLIKLGHKTQVSSQVSSLCMWDFSVTIIWVSSLYLWQKFYCCCLLRKNKVVYRLLHSSRLSFFYFKKIIALKDFFSRWLQPFTPWSVPIIPHCQQQAHGSSFIDRNTKQDRLSLSLKVCSGGGFTVKWSRSSSRRSQSPLFVGNLATHLYGNPSV